ncbi:choice-of-anchor L family PEP-CTERM protein [Chamaesiphon sp. VAR_48_metabat_135_sub]|uniref:choice-of-anchor L family PEP-CTERM protein n=1 Tax=Chamaesiphon sp. VAR_48_metabat_135_sub TaxID=2964699 RepID=UPI00286D0213|nr:choice-of-anchor L domain-containing protein [Chamaesiphon sp. VAR_48_metabat_135_sub]
MAGDADLSALAGGGSTFDASVLTFDFTSTSSDIFFNFVFASSEYPQYVGTGFNDIFGLLVDGQNIALIPGTTTAVTINNVNAGANAGFFNDNSAGSFGNIPYGGFTTVFTASLLGLTPGTHTMKIAIADIADSSLDSAVFIEAGTFSSTDPTAVPEPFTVIGTLVGGTAAFRMKKKIADSSK